MRASRGFDMAAQGARARGQGKSEVEGEGKREGVARACARVQPRQR